MVFNLDPNQNDNDLNEEQLDQYDESVNLYDYSSEEEANAILNKLAEE